MDAETLKTNITSGDHWLRLLYMVLFAVLLYFAGVVMVVVVVLQFLFALLSGHPNKNLRQFGESLSRYIFQALQFLTYSREEKPFPFSDWPTSEDELAPAESGTPKTTRSAPRRKKRTAKAKTAPKTAKATQAPDSDTAAGDQSPADDTDNNKPA